MNTPYPLHDDPRLTIEGLRVLAAIHLRGLIVRWSFGVPHPRYEHDFESASGEDMPDTDWRVLVTQLERHGTRSVVMQAAHPDVFVTREYIQHQRRYHVTSIARIVHVTNETLEDIRQRKIEEDEIRWQSWDAEGSPDMEISCEVSPEIHSARHSYRYRESEYLDIEKIDMDDTFEEHAGIVFRYVLTDSARQLLKVGQ